MILSNKKRKRKGLKQIDSLQKQLGKGETIGGRERDSIYYFCFFHLPSESYAIIGARVSVNGVGSESGGWHRELLRITSPKLNRDS